MRWTVLAFLAMTSAAAPQETGEEARKAIQALIDLKEGDDEGFDAQADTLMRIGADALGPLEAAMKGQKGEPAFRLKRVRDMIWYPLNVKGAVAISPGTTEGAKKANWPVGGVALTFNGQAVTGHQEYGRLLRDAEKAGIKVATVELLEKGRRRTIEIEGLRMGGSIGDYPHVLAQYVHQGHRSAAWDEAVQAVIAPWNEKAGEGQIDQIVAAVRAGCRDPLVLFRALAGLSGRRNPEEMAKLWKEARERLQSKTYGGLWTAECRYMAGLALCQTGELDEALRLNEEARKGYDQAGRPAGLAAADIQRAAFLEEKDGEKSVALMRSALDAYDRLRIHECWRHFYLAHLLRSREKWDDVAAMAERYGTDKLRIPAPLNDAHDMMGRFRNRTLSIVPLQRLYPTDEAAKNGRAGGLTGRYFKAPNFGGDPILRVDPEICFRWGESAPLAEIPQDDFSVRWTGKLDPEFTDTYTFSIRCDDGVRLWIDGKEVINVWTDGPPRYVTGTAALTAGRKTDIKLEYYERGGGAQVELYWDCPSFAATVKPVSWTLVYRHNFEVSSVRDAFQDRPREARKEAFSDRSGKLRINGDRLRGEGASWGWYRNVRVEADLQLLPNKEESRSCRAGLRACLDPTSDTEVGFGLGWPDAVDAYLYRDRNGAGFWVPRIDLRKPHRLALEVHQGKATYFVDGKAVDLQFFPSNWAGAWGLRGSDGTFEIDNLEIFVPSEKAAEVDKLRALYDEAAESFQKKDVPATLGSLEAAAALQPRIEELGKLYASYLAAASEGRPLLDKRLASAGHPQAIRMMLEAETHLDSSEINDEESESLRTLRALVSSGRAPEPEALTALQDSGRTGALALYALGVQRRFERGVPGVSLADVEAAYGHARSKDKTALVLPYRLAMFYRQEKLSEKADALLRDMKSRAPKIELDDDANR
jgi:hypothetical protein